MPCRVRWIEIWLLYISIGLSYTRTQSAQCPAGFTQTYHGCSRCSDSQGHVWRLCKGSTQHRSASCQSCVVVARLHASSTRHEVQPSSLDTRYSTRNAGNVEQIKPCWKFGGLGKPWRIPNRFNLNVFRGAMSPAWLRGAAWGSRFPRIQCQPFQSVSLQSPAWSASPQKTSGKFEAQICIHTYICIYVHIYISLSLYIYIYIYTY